MPSLEHLGLAAQELTMLQQLLRQERGLVLLVGTDEEARAETLRILQTALHRERPRVRAISAIARDRVQLEESDYELPDFVPAERAEHEDVPPPCPLVDSVESLEAACQAALSGTLTIAYCEGADGGESLSDWLREGADQELIGEALRVIVTHHTVAKLCPMCRVELAPSFELEALFERTFGLLGFSYPGFDLREGLGCGNCDFSGRMGEIQLYELLRVTEGIAAVFERYPEAEEIDEKAMAEQMLPWEAKLFFALKRGHVALGDAAGLLMQE